MSEFNSEVTNPGQDLLIDLAIDRVVIRRTAPGGQAFGELGPDEAVITELSELDPISWPGDEVGERITAAVTAAAGLSAAAWGPTATRAPARHRHEPGPVARHRSVRSRWLIAAAAAAAAALVAAGLHLADGTAARRQPITQPSGPEHSRPGNGSTRGDRPTSLTAMVVVSRTGALQAVGAVSSDASFLTCVTRSICYIEALRDGGSHYDIARTLDGGASWTAGAALPPFDFEWNAGITCPAPDRCFAPFGPLGLLKTTDGFAHVQLQPVSMPPGMAGELDWLSCPTTRNCVAAVTLSNGSPTFIYSSDAGNSWSGASVPAFGADGRVVALRCDRGGACIAAVVGGTAPHPIVAALGSTDGGASWTASASYSLPEMEQWMVSCGDGQNCVVGFNDGFLAFMHVARGPGQNGTTVTVRTQAFLKDWPAMGTAVSCPSGHDCFVATADPNGGGYDNATIEVTRDGGRTWTSLGTPMAPALPHDIASFLSCPVSAGCIGVGNDPSQAEQNSVVLSNLHSSRQK